MHSTGDLDVGKGSNYFLSRWV